MMDLDQIEDLYKNFDDWSRGDIYQALSSAIVIIKAQQQFVRTQYGDELEIKVKDEE